jgi:hypothetical protein
MVANIVDTSGNLIEVGGASEAIAPAEFRDQIGACARAAQDLGVKAQFDYDSGTPQNVLDIALGHLFGGAVDPSSQIHPSGL